MGDKSPVISLLPVVGVGETHAWPPRIVRGSEIGKRGDAITIWSARSQDQQSVGVTVLEKNAPPAIADSFADAAKRLELPSPIDTGILPVTAVDANGRWVVHASILGSLADSPSLGWKLARKLEVYVSLCTTVAKLHDTGTIHGALSPSSIALDDALHPLLVSAHGASIWDADEGLHYSAPELVMGALPTRQSDVHSLGRILAFLLVGERPPIEKEPVPLLEYLQKAPAGLSRIVRKATLAEPALRYASVADLLRDVGSYGDFSKVGIAHEDAVELNKTGLSKPPVGAVAAAQQPPKAILKPYVSLAPSNPSRVRLLFGLGAVLAAMALFAFGDPLWHAWGKWRTQRAFDTASPAEKGQAIARMAAIGERQFDHARLAGVDLSRSPLSGTSFMGADLTNAKLDGSDLGEANFGKATLTNASVLGANLSGASMKDAIDVETVVCDEATMPPASWRCAAGRLARSP